MLTVLVAGSLIAACGSSKTSTSASASTSGTGTSSTSSASSARAQLVSCLRQHGVTLPSRPAGAGSGTTPGGGAAGGGRGLFFGGGGGAGAGFRNNPKLAAAIRACGGRNLRFRGRPGGFRISHTAINNFVSCVRKHGYPQMPSPNFSGKGSVFPSSIRSNAKFQAASRDCASVLRPAGAPNGSGGGANTTANG